MEFHEDVIFKCQGETYGQDLIEIVDNKGIKPNGQLSIQKCTNPT